MMDQDVLKKMAAEAAVHYVQDGQVVGLGTGSTVRHVIVKLAERVKGGLRIRGVPTSLETAELAIHAGIPLLADDAEWAIDVALDGADQVDPQLNLIKGGGGALLKEKIVARVAPRMQEGVLFTTEAGHLILDLWFPKIDDPARLEIELEKTPGVVGTGLFVGRADLVVVATQQGIVTLHRS